MAMKRIILTLVISLSLLTATAQMRTAYFMEGSYFRTDLNPALVPGRGYVAIPVLSGLGVGVNNNFLSVNNFVYNRDGETVLALDSRVDSEEFLGRLPKKGHLSLNSDINLLAAGFSAKKMFWNFGVKARVNFDVVTSKDLFAALKSLGNNSYDLSTVGFDGTAYSEIYIGACRPIFDWLRVGARVKGLVGVINVGGQLSEGNFSITRSQIVGSLRGDLHMSGLMVRSDYKTGEIEEVSDILEEEFSTAGLKSGGFGVDLGAEARFLNDKLRVSLSITDLGFISWSKSAAARAEFGYGFTYKGVNLTTGEVDMQSDDNISMVAPSGYTKSLNTTLNIGAEYTILNNWISFGLLSHTEFRQLYTLSELIASVNFRVGKSFSATLSHTFCGRNRAGIFGAAINVHTAGLNLFLGADYIDTNYASTGEMVVPKFQKSLNYYFGLGFNLGKTKF